MIKKGLIVFALILVLTLSIVSAFSFGDFYQKITGSAVDDSESENKIIVYATNEIYGGNLGGREGADEICENEKPSTLSCSNFHAFLSVGEDDEIRDLPYSYGYNPSSAFYWYNNLNNSLKKFANNLSDALDGSIEVDARTGTGRPLYYHYWTGASANGAVNVDRDIDGNDYATADGWTSRERYGTRGNADKKDSGWVTNTGKYAGTRDDGALLCVCEGYVKEETENSVEEVDEEDEEEQEGIEKISCVGSYCEGTNKTIFPMKNSAGLFVEYPYECEGDYWVDVRGTNWASYCSTKWIQKTSCEGFENCPAEFGETEKKEFNCVNKSCRGYNSKLNIVRNSVSQINPKEMCCDGVWYLNVEGGNSTMLCCEPGFFVGKVANANCDSSKWHDCEINEDSETTSDDSEENSEDTSQECDANECESEGRCYSIGYRKGDVYCGEEGEFNFQLVEEESCENDFECESNICLSGSCVDRNLIEKIISWLKSVFSGEN